MRRPAAEVISYANSVDPPIRLREVDDNGDHVVLHFEVRGPFLLAEL